MAKIDKILGSISPLYGMASGEGLFSNLRKISPVMQLAGEGDTAAEKRRRAARGDKKTAAELAEEGKTASLKHGGMVKKMAKGGAVKKMANGGMPSMKESMESGNRVSEQVGKETKRMMPPKKRTMPSPGESVKSGNRMSGEDAKDLKAVKKYAKGGSVTRGDGCAVRGKTKGKIC
jgi:hypothetical protein